VIKFIAKLIEGMTMVGKCVEGSRKDEADYNAKIVEGYGREVGDIVVSRRSIGDDGDTEAEEISETQKEINGPNKV
jgi:hypothetical protein